MDISGNRRISNPAWWILTILAAVITLHAVSVKAQVTKLVEGANENYSINFSDYTGGPIEQWIEARGFIFAPALAYRLNAGFDAVKRAHHVEVYHAAHGWTVPDSSIYDKGEADRLVSFCGQGAKKTGDTKFEMTKSNFSPDGDLAVLILKKMGK